MKFFTFSWFPLLFVVLQWISSSYCDPSNPYRHSDYLDRFTRNFHLTWEVNWTQRTVTFNTTVATRGWVGFGIARGQKVGADIVFGGVHKNGSLYFSDRHSLGDSQPALDTSQDWNLHSGWENSTHTFLSFSRPFHTCDTQHDQPITDDLSNLVWAYTTDNSDDITQYHQLSNRGIYNAYLLDPELTPDLEEFRNLEDQSVTLNMSRFEMMREFQLPQVDTMYWCHFFRAPTTTKQHIIGFNTVFPTLNDERHVHHLLVHRCKAPPGFDPVDLFDDATRTPGTECFFVGDPHELPTEYCQEVVHLWGVGGRPIFFPEHAGLSMTSDGPEYFMIQVHYDNPQLESSKVTFGVDAYYTENLRENDVGMMPLGEMTPAATSIVIPPNSPNHQILGHCAPDCLQKILPPEGVMVFAGFLHTHLLGNGVRFRHFRGGQELPFISNADNYQFNFQQFRLLINERKVVPGDQLGMRCTYDIRSRNGSAVVGGHSTRDEMCTGHLYYYTKRSIQFSFCRSELRHETYLNRLGIRNTTWDPTRRQMMVTSSSIPNSVGLTIYEYANQRINWTPEMSEAIQNDQLNLPQLTLCPVVDDTPPDVQEWEDSGVLAWDPTSEEAGGAQRYESPPQCTMKDYLGGSRRFLRRLGVRGQTQNEGHGHVVTAWARKKGGGLNFLKKNVS